MKKQRQLRRCALGVLLCLGILSLTPFCFAGSTTNHVSIGRYLSVAAKPQREQQRLLQQQFQIRFPQNIFTVKQAVEFILKFRGYRLAEMNKMHRPARDMLNQPLPEVDKKFGPMCLKEGLITLAGKLFYLLVDPVHRLIAFKLKAQYRKLYTKTHKRIFYEKNIKMRSVM